MSAPRAVRSVRIALANLRFPATPDETMLLATRAVADAAARGAAIVCFPECFVPGYRAPTRAVPPPDAAFLDRAWDAVTEAAAAHRIAVVLGTERVVDGRLRITSLVVNADGSVAGFQDKVQLDPSEDGPFAPGAGRAIFHAGPLAFGVVICHEGWRYPETVRWAARRGAHVVFHPHFHEAEPGSYRPTTFADPANTFHEKAALCRAAENTVWFATVTALRRAPRARRPSCAPTGRCSRGSRTASRGCSSPTSTSTRRRGSSPRAAERWREVSA